MQPAAPRTASYRHSRPAFEARSSGDGLFGWNRRSLYISGQMRFPTNLDHSFLEPRCVAVTLQSRVLLSGGSRIAGQLILLRLRYYGRCMTSALENTTDNLQHIRSLDVKSNLQKYAAISLGGLSALCLGACSSNENYKGLASPVTSVVTSLDNVVAESVKDQSCDIPMPQWIPEVVNGSTIMDCDRFYNGSIESGVPDSVIVNYTLKSAVNQSSIPEGLDWKTVTDEDATSGKLHPATEIQYIIWNKPDLIDNDGICNEYMTCKQLTLPNGLNARLATFYTGYGPIRLEWSDGEWSYLLLTENNFTNEGVSGPRIDDLTKIAGSISRSLCRCVLLSYDGVVRFLYRDFQSH